MPTVPAEPGEPRLPPAPLVPSVPLVPSAPPAPAGPTGPWVTAVDLPLTTARLLLRRPVAADLEDLVSYQSLPEVVRYVPYPPRTREQVAALIADPVRNPAEVTADGHALWLAAERRSDGRVVGDVVQIRRSTEHRCAEIGYVFHSDVAGQGLATEAGAALLAAAFDGWRAHRVIGRVDARNTASAAVLRRLGMRQEAHLRENEWFKGEWTDEIDFALLADEWRGTPGE